MTPLLVFGIFLFINGGIFACFLTSLIVTTVHRIRVADYVMEDPAILATVNAGFFIVCNKNEDWEQADEVSMIYMNTKTMDAYADRLIDPELYLTCQFATSKLNSKIPFLKKRYDSLIELYKLHNL